MDENLLTRHRAIAEICARHKGNLRDGATIRGMNNDMSWHDVVNSDTDPFGWGLYFVTNPGDAQKTCEFDCETLFGAFADSSECK